MAEQSIPHTKDHETRNRGDPVPVISRHSKADDQRENTRRQDALDVKLESESDKRIAEAVEQKATTRTQAGAHAGPVGSAHGPGYSGDHKE